MVLKKTKVVKITKKQKSLLLLIKLEIERIVTDVNSRKKMLYKLWSKERVRQPLINVLRSKFVDLDFKTMLLLSDKLNKILNNFYKDLDDFIFYISYTEDMPQTLKQQFELYVKNLNKNAEESLKELKGVINA